MEHRRIEPGMEIVPKEIQAELWRLFGLTGGVSQIFYLATGRHRDGFFPLRIVHADLSKNTVTTHRHQSPVEVREVRVAIVRDQNGTLVMKLLGAGRPGAKDTRPKQGNLWDE